MSKKILLIALLLAAPLHAQTVTVPGNPARNAVFVENKSQWEDGILFGAVSDGLSVVMTRYGLHYNFFKKELRNGKVLKQGQGVNMQFIGMNSLASFKGVEQESGLYNFFYGRDPKSWVSNARAFKTLKAENIYDGIDAVVMLADGLPRYDFEVRPGADPRTIELKFDGADNISIDGNGNLVLKTGIGNVYNGRLFAYQPDQGQSHIDCKFIISDKNTVKFDVGAYDRSLPLIIDPTVYTTYIGGGSEDEMKSLVLDEQGNIITAGWTSSDDFTLTTGAYDTTFAFGTDAVVTKCNPAMTTMIFSTFIGGAGDDIIHDITIDGTGALCIAGETSSPDFPTRSGAYTQINQGQTDGFAIRMNAAGSSLVYSSYLGGSKDDHALAVKTDANNNMYITGKTGSTNFPTTTGAYDRVQNGLYDAFIVKFSSGNSLQYSTFIGGGNDDIAYDITVDAGANVYIAGETSSGNFPTAPVPSPFNGQSKPFDALYNGAVDGFITKFNTSGNTLTFSTFLGGEGDDRVRAIGLGPSNIVLVAGETGSPDFPLGSVSGGAKSGGMDIFAGRLDAPGKTFTFSWLTGASGNETVKSAVMDSDGNYYIAGFTSSSTFPTTQEATKKTPSGGTDGFIVKLNSNGVQNSALIGGNAADIINAITIDARNNPYVAGKTGSGNLLTSELAFKNTLSGTSDGFIAKDVFATIDLNVPVGGEKWCGGTEQTIQWFTTGFDAGETYSVQLSSGESMPWQIIASGISALSYKWAVPFTLPTGNQYKIRIVSASGLIKQSSSLTISQGPVITMQPQAVTLCEGQALSLTVEAISTSPTYQWYRNGNPISGATTATYSVPATTLNQNGSYTVQITGTCSSTPVTSQVATVTVNPATAIALSPGNVNTTVGQPVTLVAAATGQNNVFQWQKNGMDISTATSPVYSIPSAQKSDEGTYRAIVTGTCGADTSDEAQVIVNTTSIDYSELPNGSLKIENVAPNPVATTAQILLKSTKESVVNVSIIDANGATVQEIFKGNISGNRTIAFDTKNLASGSYWIIAEQNGQKVRYELRVVR